MNILDEWDSGAVPTYTENAGGADVGTFSDDDLAEGFGMASPRDTASEGPIFSLDPVERHLARGRGQATALAAASDCAVVGTSRAFVVRYDFSQGTAPVAEVELSKAADARISALWVDNTASHVLAQLSTGTSLGAAPDEVYYLHARWKKARPLGRLRGMQLSAVAFHPTAVTEAATGEMLLGTATGALLEMSLEERERREPPPKQLYSLGGAQHAVRGVALAPLRHGRMLALVATPSRLLVFAGGPALEPLFAAYPEPPGLANFVELAGGGSGGALATFTPVGADLPVRFAWLAEPGLYQGNLALNLEEVPASELEYLADHRLLPYPRTTQDAPTALALTECHDMLLRGARLQMVNRVSGALVQEIALTGPRAAPALGAAPPLGLAADHAAATLYLFTGEALMEVAARDEERDMWRVHLERGDFSAAARAASTQAQRAAVAAAEAGARYAEGDLAGAARLWGALPGAGPSFEEAALKLVDAGAHAALQAFLLARLGALARDDKAQATMVATWLVELYLDQINRALLEEGATQEGAVAGLTQQLRDFLKAHVSVLDVAVTVNLLASYGRMEDLMHYATYRQDNEAILEYLVQRGEAGRALAVLRRPGVSPELAYKFAPALLALAPSDTVDAWMAAQPPLNPRRLLPALLQLGEAGAKEPGRADAMRYVQFCIHRLGSTDAAVHNLAVALLSGEEDEAGLQAFLSASRDALGRPMYDAQFALRLARQRGLLRACVHLYCDLGLFEDAVALALQFDRELAGAVAGRTECDEALSRKLWMAIARHVIAEASSGPDAPMGQGVAAVVEVLREAGGAVRIEDLLPLLPDFATIGAVQGAVCESLAQYAADIQRLKQDMADATRVADALRRDMAALEQRTATLDLAAPCARCGRSVGGPAPPEAGPSGGAVPRFYLFPTGNTFHGACLAAEVAAGAPPPQRARIRDLMTRLAAAGDSQNVKGAQPADMADLVRKLEEEIAVEDPHNGECVVRLLSRPFIRDDEAAEVAAWQI